MTKGLWEVVSTEPRKAILRAYEEAPLKPDEIRVKVNFAAAKHGTEFTLFQGDSVLRDHDYNEEMHLFTPRPGGAEEYFMWPGNMWVGHVTEVGSEAAGVEAGMRVCGYGPFRSTQTLKAKWARIVPEDMSWKTMMYYDPLQFALGGIRDGNVRPGDAVAVFGLGAIGQMAAQLAKRAGALTVFACDPIARRREAAAANGADVVLDSAQEDAGRIIKEKTGGRGADVVLECSGYYRALQSAIRAVAYNGNVAVTGWYHECTGGLNLGWEAHFNQPNILMSRACSEPNRDAPRWTFERLCDASWEMLAKGWFHCENLIYPLVPLERAAQTYMDIYNDPTDSVKMGVCFD